MKVRGYTLPVVALTGFFCSGIPAGVTNWMLNRGRLYYELPEHSLPPYLFRKDLVVLYAATLAVTLLAGFLVCRRLTRREVFCSATLVVLARALKNAACPGLMLYFIQWDHLLPLLAAQLTSSPWPPALVDTAAPYLFVIFGGRAVEETS